MKNIIIAVKSSFQELQTGTHDYIRSGWAQPFRGRAIVKFFLGRSTSEIGGVSRSVAVNNDNSYSPKSDEVILHCPDDLDTRVWKTRSIAKWFVDKAASHILIVDAATAVSPILLNTNFDTADYAGKFNGDIGVPGPKEIAGQVVEQCYPWAEPGFILSKKAAIILSDSTPRQSKYIHAAFDDYWVGQILGPLTQRSELMSKDLEGAWMRTL